MSDISNHERNMRHLGEIKEGVGDYDAETIECGAAALEKLEGWHPKNEDFVVLTQQEREAVSDMLDNGELRDLCRAFRAAGMIWDTI